MTPAQTPRCGASTTNPIAARKWHLAVLIPLLALLLAACDRAAEPAPLSPWDSLNGQEMQLIADLIKESYGQSVLITQMSLTPTDKAAALAWQPGQEPPRSAFVTFLHDKKPWQGKVDLNRKTLTTAPIEVGQPMLSTDGELIPILTTAIPDNPKLVELLRARNLDPEDVLCAPLTAGQFFDSEVAHSGHRLLAIECYDIGGTRRNLFARPLEGISGLFDVTQGQLVRIEDSYAPGAAPPLSEDTGDYHSGAIEQRHAPNRIGHDQRGGPNYHLYHFNGGRIDWQGWRFHLRFDVRQGTVLNHIQYRDEASQSGYRRIAYELGMSEMVVPYQDPTNGWFFRSYFDMGEYGFGNSATELKGADCPDRASYLDVTLHNAMGQPYIAEDRICVFEHDPELPIWRHAEPILEGIPLLEPHESRTHTQLIVRMAATIGNYDYFQDYILQQDGRLRIRLTSTGLDAVKGVHATSLSDPSAEADTRYGDLIAPGRVGINHDHFFNYRIDLDVDGASNNFQRHKLRPVNLSKRASKRTSIWRLERQTVTNELAARTRIDPAAPALLLVTSGERQNALGYPSGYRIIPSAARSIVDPRDPSSARAGFTHYNLWVTPYSPDEIYAAGTHIYHGPPLQGLPKWSAADRPISDEDLVAWVTVGFHHAPIAEDWPVLPAKSEEIVLKPHHFFDRNPSIDLPE